MINYQPADPKRVICHSIFFDDEGLEKILLVLNRALNTYHDPELTKLLDEIKEVK